MRHLFNFAAVAALSWCGYAAWHTRPIRHEPGVLVAEEPVQEDIAPEPLPDVAGFHLTAVARYSITGRVLGTKRYWDGEAAKLAPRDVALAWGRMSDQAVLDHLGLSMGNRFFFYEWEEAPPIPTAEIMCHASNNHVIAAKSEVARAIRRLRVGEVVTLSGYLVDAVGPDGYPWTTSRRRDDTGNGACELFYVEAVR